MSHQHCKRCGRAISFRQSFMNNMCAGCERSRLLYLETELTLKEMKK